MSVARSFGFSASAVAFGGLIKRQRAKKSQPITGVASVALSPSGGVSESFTRRYKENGVSFKDARTRVEGTIDGDVYTTVSTVELAKLDILGRVQCDAMQAVVQSRRGKDDADATFSVKATFDGLRVLDTDLRLPLDFTLFRKVPTYSQFLEFFSDEANMKKFAPAFGWTKENGPDVAMLKAAREGKLVLADPIRCSLVTRRVDKDTEFRQDGYTLIADDFGKIHLAELLVKPGRRRIHMLRLEIQKPGSAPTARSAMASRSHTGETMDATFGSGEGNGSPTYP